MEIKAPEILNGVQLQKELKDAGIILNDYPRLNDGILVLEIDTKDEPKAIKIVESHVAIDQSQFIAQARQEVLNRIGLTEEEIRLILG